MCSSNHGDQSRAPHTSHNPGSACSSWCSIKEVAEKRGGGDVCGGDGGGGNRGR